MGNFFAGLLIGLIIALWAFFKGYEVTIRELKRRGWLK